MYHCYFDKLFKQIDTAKTGEFELKDFVKLVQTYLEHNEEFEKLYEKYCENRTLTDNPIITQTQLQNLFKEEQKEEISANSCSMLIQVASSFLYTEYGDLKKLTAANQEENAILDITATESQKIIAISEKKALKDNKSVECARGLNIRGLSNMLLSKTNVFATEKAVTHSLNNPFPHYIINTSVYTYLSYNQTEHRFEANAKNYGKYLLKGVRCVDISLIVFL
jgi:hypothetical protein